MIRYDDILIHIYILNFTYIQYNTYFQSYRVGMHFYSNEWVPIAQWWINRYIDESLFARPLVHISENLMDVPVRGHVTRLNLYKVVILILNSSFKDKDC